MLATSMCRQMLRCTWSQFVTICLPAHDRMHDMQMRIKATHWPHQAGGAVVSGKRTSFGCPPPKGSAHLVSTLDTTTGRTDCEARAVDRVGGTLLADGLSVTARVKA